MTPSKKAICIADIACNEDADGFRYWQNLPASGKVPRFAHPDFTATTVGWKRHSTCDGYRVIVSETLRLPIGYRWIQTGFEQLSDDLRDYTRTGLTDPDPNLPDVNQWTTAFTRGGYLTSYFIRKQDKSGAPRIERESSDGSWHPVLVG